MHHILFLEHRHRGLLKPRCWITQVFCLGKQTLDAQRIAPSIYCAEWFDWYYRNKNSCTLFFA